MSKDPKTQNQQTLRISQMAFGEPLRPLTRPNPGNGTINPLVFVGPWISCAVVHVGGRFFDSDRLLRDFFFSLVLPYYSMGYTHANSLVQLFAGLLFLLQAETEISHFEATDRTLFRNLFSSIQYLCWEDIYACRHMGRWLTLLFP